MGATTTAGTNPNLKRVPVSFSSGGKTYIMNVSKGFTTGDLFAFMGYALVGETPPAGAITLKRADVIENGLAISLTAECKTSAGRIAYPKILVPTPKIEEVIKSGAGKKIGTNRTVIKVRATKNRLLSA
jgi:hypothetical protein